MRTRLIEGWASEVEGEMAARGDLLGMRGGLIRGLEYLIHMISTTTAQHPSTRAPATTQPPQDQNLPPPSFPHPPFAAALALSSPRHQRLPSPFQPSRLHLPGYRNVRACSQHLIRPAWLRHGAVLPGLLAFMGVSFLGSAGSVCFPQILTAFVTAARLPSDLFAAALILLHRRLMRAPGEMGRGRGRACGLDVRLRLDIKVSFPLLPSFCFAATASASAIDLHIDLVGATSSFAGSSSFNV